MSECYICSTKYVGDTPYYCDSCGLYAKNKTSGFVYDFVKQINVYNWRLADMKKWVFLNISEKLEYSEKIKISYQDLRELAESRRDYNYALKYIFLDEFKEHREKARVEIAIFELIKVMGESSGITKNQINEIVKLPSNRFISINKLMGDKLQKKGGSFLYGKIEIEMLLHGMC